MGLACRILGEELFSLVKEFNERVDLSELVWGGWIQMSYLGENPMRVAELAHVHQAESFSS